MHRLLFVLAIGWSGVSLSTALAVVDETPLEFNRDIRPILSRKCFACHGPDDAHREADLRLDQRASALLDRDGTRAIVPGDRKDSELYYRVTTRSDIERMPPEGTGHRLTAGEIDRLGRWIDAGAPYARHWSFEPPRRPELPKTSDPSWSRNPIDDFVQARLEQAELEPSAEADRHTLIRRLSLDLTGLPPTLQETEAFVLDSRPDAIERVVDRLLASSAYGERWARVWLDLARYADSSGYGSDPLRTIWRYRDWVIDAYNRNLPFDTFTIHQLAGDLLPEPTVDQLLATAFHRNTKTNTEGGTDDEEFRVEAVKDRTNTTFQVWMGLTMGCAQCHNHKFDPIAQREYYQAFALFNQTEDTDQPDDRPRLETPTAEQSALLAALDARREKLERQLDDIDLSDGRRRWERQQLDGASRWQIWHANGETESETEIQTEEDGTLVAHGPAGDRDTYRLRGTTGFERVTALRLETLPDTTLPGGGPGRSPGNGNFVLSEIRVHAVPIVRRPIVGRRVRIDLPGASRILSLAEVQVIAEGVNVARLGTATQSSTGYEAVAARAIDGNTDGEFFRSQSVTHNNQEPDPWWEVDLGSDQAIDQVVVWSRTDGNLQNRLDGARLSVLDEAGEVLWLQTLAKAPKNDALIDVAGGGRELSIASASADFSQKDWTIDEAIDGRSESDQGWGIGPEQGKRHEAVLHFTRPEALQPGEQLEVTLVQSYGGQHTLGRLRLSWTNAAAPPRAVTPEVGLALTVPEAERTQEQRAALAEAYRTFAPEIAELRVQLGALEKERGQVSVATTPVMRELPIDQQRESHVLIKGNFLQKSETVTPAVPASFHPWPEDAPRDRIGLARWLVSRDNPLTARVTANRYWSKLFGRGLVETEEDFGSQGLPPTHPELLDWLAVELMQSGWDVKELLRTIVTSATYLQSSDVRAEHLERDPNNQLYARGPRFRLEAEIVRDQALALSGLLSRKMHGPSVFPAQPEGLWQAAFNGERSWSTSEGEDRYRRGLYVFWRRTAPYPSMEVFDAPSRETCTLRRIRTATPLQAFVTLNDPVYVEAAQALARRILEEGGARDTDRARWALELVQARPASAAQVSVLVRRIEEERAHFTQHRDDARRLASQPLGELPPHLDAIEAAAWTVGANVLLNLDSVLTKS